MTAALRCDDCGTVVCEDDDAHADWLRVERNGQGLGPLGPLPSVVLNAATFVTVDGEPQTDGMDGDELAVPEESAPVRHFCSWSCLAEYAHQAEVVE